MGTNFKIAFIGGGVNSAVGRTHKIAAEMDGAFTLVCGAFSRNATINAHTAKEYGVDQNRTYLDWRELLEKEQYAIDAIVLLTPTPNHAEIIEAIVTYKIPIICEKSLSHTIESGKSIVHSVQETNTFFAVTYNYTGYPMVREMKHIISSGIIGKIQQIMIEMPQESFLRRLPNGEVASPQNWRLQDFSIPTVSLDLGSHLHNMVWFLTGLRPQSVYAHECSYGNFTQIVDTVHSIVEYESNMICNYWFGKTALGNTNGLRIRIYGELGSMEWYQLNPEVILYNTNKGVRYTIDKGSSMLQVACAERYSRFKAGHPAGFIEAFANYYSDIAQALKEFKLTNTNTNNFIFNVQHGYESLQLMNAMHISHLQKSLITI